MFESEKTMTGSDNGIEEKEALKFLERDFNQCFQQIRYYDAQIFDILKFMFTAYTVLIGAALGLFKSNLQVNLTIPIVISLMIGLILGTFMFYLVLINRSYYVRVARYINEQRKLFLAFKPLGFENISRMHTNEKQPYFSRESTQIWLAYIIGALNSTLLGVLLFIVFAGHNLKWLIAGASSLIFLIAQLAITIAYLKLQEKKTASEAVSGKK
jgi:hypothetical protein